MSAPRPRAATAWARRAALLASLFAAAWPALGAPTAASAPAARCRPAPLGDTPLYLRGSMNNWSADDTLEFQWACDAYRLNVQLQGRHEFKIADADWTDRFTVSDAGANFARQFDGEQTLTLRWVAGQAPQLALGPRSFEPQRSARAADPVAQALHFDSRALAHKSPFGAQPQGTEFRFAVHSERPGVQAVTLVVEQRQLSGNQERLAYTPLARVPLRPAPHGLGTRFEGRYRFAAAGVYGYWFEVQTAQGRYALQNNRDSVYWTREKGSMGPGLAEPLPAQLARVRRFRQTIHLAELQVPDWSADVVYYYLFPERFRNGDRSNDPQPGRQRYQSHDIERHARWLEDPYKPGVSGDAVHSNDFFGGDLAGIIEKLDDIRALGANTLYMTPLFQAPSNHKYDTADYHRIDPGFGTNADFERLAREAARRGMRLLPDTSLNHVGADSPYFDRFGNHAGADGRSRGAFAGGQPNPDSPYRDWFLFDPRQREPDAQYQGWVGIKDLPELNKASPAWRAFAYGDDDSVTRRWLRAGASGWRMDVAPWVPDDFWRAWRRVVKAEKPDALAVAETWFDASKFLLGDAFDGTMNYIFRNAVLDFAAGQPASRIYPSLELLREAYPLPNLLASMNLLSTHDAPRALHVFGIEGNPHTTPGIDPARLAEAKRRLLLAVLFQVGFPGAPTVYYGDEVGVGGGDDPFNRATYPWPDEGGRPDLQLREGFQQRLALRHRHAVLRRGSLSAPLHLDAHGIAFERQLGAQRALVLLNNGREPLPLTLPRAGRWTDALSGETVQAVGGRLTLQVPALDGRILLSE